MRKCARHSARLTIRRLEPAWVQTRPQEVDRRLEQRRIDLDGRGQVGHGGVGRDEVPGTIEYDRRVGLVRGEDAIERLAHGREPRIGEGALGKRRGVAGGEQQLVSLSEGDLKLLGDRQEHVATGLRATGLDEAEMTRRDARVAVRCGHLAATLARAGKHVDYLDVKDSQSSHGGFS